MGQRCNLVIIENNQATVYYDHWAANKLDVELLWGPQIARKFIEEREPRPDSWLDETWSEGGCVIDFDTQHLLWYGGEDILHEPEKNLISQELIKIQWKGWKVEWARDGIFDIARKAGVPVDLVTSDYKSDAEILTQPHIYKDEAYTFFYANNVVSYIDRGELRWAALQGRIESLANTEMTPDIIANLVRNFSETEFENGKLLDPKWGNFYWGAHFDFDATCLKYWNPNPSEGLQSLIEKRLPEWTVLDYGPDYLWHETLTPSKDWPKITLQIKLDYLEMCRHIISQNDINPLVNILNTMTNDGQRNIQVNPQVWERRKGHQDIRQVKNSILDSLELILKRQY